MATGIPSKGSHRRQRFRWEKTAGLSLHSFSSANELWRDKLVKGKAGGLFPIEIFGGDVSLSKEFRLPLKCSRCAAA